MITIIRSADRFIKSYSSGTDPTCDSAAGETVEYLDVAFTNYANRLSFSALGMSGVTLTALQGVDPILVIVSCPGFSSVNIAINGECQSVSLVNGHGEIRIPAHNPSVFVIAPADRAAFCAAGNGLLCVEIID